MVTPMLASVARAKPTSLMGMRVFQVTLSCIGTVLAFSMRSSFSVIIIAMVDKKSANPDYPEYDWNEETQSVILSGFPWGVFILQVPSGLLASKYGQRRVIALSQVLVSLAGILIPVAASGGWGLVLACRFVQGLGQGMLAAAFQVHLVRWVPVEEKGFLIPMIYAAGALGNVFGTLTSGVLCVSAGGWPSTFYVFGGLGLAWTVLWMWLGSNTPAEDRYISVEERAYIEVSLRTSDQSVEALATPWRAIVTSLPVWATIVANCGWAWGAWLWSTELPTFMEDILGFHLEANGFLSALPYFLLCITCVVMCIVSECLKNRTSISLIASRKLFNSIGCFVPAAALIALCFSHHLILCVVLLNVAVASTAALFVGFLINHVDLAPNFAGIVYGLSSGMGNFVGCLAPLFTGVVVTDPTSMAQWEVVFFFTVGIYISAGIFFLIYGQAEEQSWNDPMISERKRLLGDSDR